MKALKKVVYYNHVHGKNEHDPELRAIPDEAFAAKMEKVALAYANWDKEQDKVLTAIEKGKAEPQQGRTQISLKGEIKFFGERNS